MLRTWCRFLSILICVAEENYTLYLIGLPIAFQAASLPLAASRFPAMNWKGNKYRLVDMLSAFVPAVHQDVPSELRKVV